MSLDACIAALVKATPKGMPLTPDRHACGAPLAASQAMYFCGYDPECRTDVKTMLARSKSNLLQHYIFVGLLEEYDLSMQCVRK